MDTPDQAADVAASTEQHGGTEIISAGDGRGFVSETEALAEMRLRKLDTALWTIARNPNGDGFCLVTFKKIVELQRQRDSDARRQIGAGGKPPVYIEVHFGPNMDPSKPDKQTETIMVNGAPRLITLGMKAIITDADLEVIEHATVENWVPKDTPDGRPVMQAGYKPRVSVTVLRRNVSKAEYEADRKKNTERFNQFQAERRAISEGVRG